MIGPCEKVESYLRSLGFKVEYADLVKVHGGAEGMQPWVGPTDGAIDFTNCKIWIADRLTSEPRKMLLTLLHETGHAIAGNAFDHQRNENNAYYVGWEIAKYLQLPISRHEWKEFNWEAAV